jgi:hypothetical protein
VTVESRPGESLREAVARRVLSPEGDAALSAAVARVSAAAGDSLDGLLFFGSRRTGAARANAWSAYDVFVVVRAYRPFYEAMTRAGLSGKSPLPLAALSLWLPPTQYSIRIDDPEVHLKTAVIRTDTLHRETSAGRRDHFCIGRLFQPSRLLHARDAALREALVADVVAAHVETWRWVRPWLPPAFDAAAYGKAALSVSMSWEVRPEPAGRAEALWAAQAAEQIPVFEALLRDLGERGELRPGSGGAGWWCPARPVSRAETFALKAYFRRSIARATARWLKHMLSFEGWLDYIVRKASRHSGQTIELTERERRWPWLFAWGRVLRYLRTKNDRGGTT